MEYAIEADPGRLTASFPTFNTFEEARGAATLPCMLREGIPRPRILARTANGAWATVREEVEHVA